MKRLYFLLFVTISVQLIGSEEVYPHYIGAAAGFSTGYGLSYRYWPGDWGTQVVFTPIADDSGYSINLGTGLFKSLYNTKNTRLFLYLAGNGTYRSYMDEVYSEDDPDVVIGEELEEGLDWGIGIGPGLEIYIFKNIVLDIMFGYRYGQGDISGLGFTGEAALYYRF